jgi:hypothetical protein
MSSRQKSTPPRRPARPAVIAPPEGWNESAPFRETSLQHFAEPGEADLLRRVGAMFHDKALELVSESHEAPGGGTRDELRAAAADLRFLQGYLALAGRDHEVSSLTDEEEVLSKLAGRLAVEVARIAQMLERAVG